VTTVAGSPTTTAPAAGSRAAQPDQPANFGGSNPSLTVDEKGTVYVAWVTHSSNISPAPVPAIWLSTSTDRGRTYAASAVTPFQQGLSTFGTQRIRWSRGGGSSGTLHLVYEGTTHPAVANDTDATYQRSTDGGRTWTPPTTLNDDDPAKLYPQNSPNIAVAPDGRVDVAWFDARNDPGTRAQDVYLTSSSDDGATWSTNVRVTDQLDDRRIGIWANGFDVSAPPGIASTNRLSVVAWDDTRNGSQLSQTQDLFTADLQFERLGGGTSKGAKVALAAVAGVAIVGLVLVGATVVTRRRT
jgi:Neuraminidase (sialidase)